ncbi:MAG: WG repeat-containing protein [Fretibacterium sp.]|nr:WG repeat-containing protein [Fretibacterium sp.]
MSQNVPGLSIRALLAILLLCAPSCLPDPAQAREVKVVIDYDYNDARDFHEGLAAVKSNDAWGYIDHLGRTVIPFVHRVPEAGSFSEGLAFVGGRFIDASGREAFDERTFQDAKPFSQGLAAVKSHGRWGYIDTAGKFVIPPSYEAAGPFSQGLAPVRKDGLWGYIDIGGRMKIPPQYLRAAPFHEGRAAVEMRGLSGYIDLSGRDLVKASFDEAGPFGNGLAPVRNASDYRGWGYVDSRGRLSIPHRYNAAGPFREGLAPVATDARWGYIDTLGRLVLDAQFDEARPFHEGLAAVRLEDRWGYISVR